MGKPISKPNQASPESFNPKQSEIVNFMKEKQIMMAESSEMFVHKSNVELITLHEEIKVVGLSFEKCKQSGSVKLDSPFDLYSRESFELQDHIKSIKYPQIGYGIWANAEKDTIVGKGVTDIDGQDEIYGSFTIPAGRYMKVSWNAETFGELVDEAMQKAWERSGADAFLESNDLIADHTLYIEVYPHETCCVGQENGPDWGPKYKKASMTTPTTQYPEMYTLCTIKAKGERR